MPETNTLAYYDTTNITTMKSFIVQTPLLGSFISHKEDEV
jgi:hypothetical protein